jgi:hypothetical protein
MPYLPEKPYQHRWCYYCGKGTDRMREFRLKKPEFGKEPVIHICDKNPACERNARESGYRVSRSVSFEHVASVLEHREEGVQIKP